MSYFDKFNNKGIPFMENRDKGDMHDLIGKTVHIEDFGFIRNDEGDYGVIIVAEDKDNFYFCNAVITDMLHQVDNDGMRDELVKQNIVFSMATSKKGREYFKFEFTGDIPF
ncbi:MAG: hypothetical protein J6O50_13290 [Ruminiclostridium sp.]|nr:hypothetical protein [Ruminiclostridium sp.]